MIDGVIATRVDLVVEAVVVTGVVTVVDVVVVVVGVVTVVDVVVGVVIVVVVVVAENNIFATMRRCHNGIIIKVITPLQCTVTRDTM